MDALEYKKYGQYFIVILNWVGILLFFCILIIAINIIHFQ